MKGHTINAARGDRWNPLPGDNARTPADPPLFAVRDGPRRAEREIWDAIGVERSPSQ